MVLLVSVGSLVVYMSALFVLAILRRDNGTADVGYGIAGIVSVVSMLLMVPAMLPHALLSVFVIVWGLRLSARIYRKNRGKPEDFRYRAWREKWGNTFLVRSYLQIYLLQGAVIFLVTLPVLLALAFPTSVNLPLLVLGILLWVVGFFFEARADFELDRFIAKKENAGKIMMEGLWRYSRHPNYFGESLMWWGLAVAASGLSIYPFWGFISPLLITYLLRFVSGVPMLEKRWVGNPEWEAYAKRTPAFFPRLPRV